METIKTMRTAALRYFGGKWVLAPWIISFFPEHGAYIEPCGGAASVLLQKPIVPVETYNDLDQEVVNFFKVLRDQADELARVLDLTPYARKEFELSFESSEDPVERARRFFIRTKMTQSGGSGRESRRAWRVNRAATSGCLPRTLYIKDSLLKAAERLKNVQIECDDYKNVIRRYDCDSALIYFDPPYVHGTRTSGAEYAYEWTDVEHRQSAEILRACKSFVVVSGYACNLYKEIYEGHGWKREDRIAGANIGKKIESLWLSPSTIEAVSIFKQLSLLDASPEAFRSNSFSVTI